MAALNHVQRTFTSLLSLLPPSESSKVQVILLAGSQTPYRNDTDRELPFRQESNFYYLSSCSIPSSHLLLLYSPSQPTHTSTHLFIPKPTFSDLLWSPAPPTLDEALLSYNVSQVSHSSDLSSVLVSILEAHPDVLIHTLPRNSPLFPELNPEYTQLALNNKMSCVTDAFLLKALHRARLVKDENEIELIRKACNISSRAHETVMRVLGLGARKGALKSNTTSGQLLMPSEWLIEKEAEAEALFVASCRREGATHQAYLPIVASSVRASTLHYCCNDKEFVWGPVGQRDHMNVGAFKHSDHKCSGEGGEGNGHVSENGLPVVEGDGVEECDVLEPQLLLIDAGCEWECYASDITRTMPVGNKGKFTSESGAIYELVLEMQSRAMALIKPGVHWDNVHFSCHRTLVEGFLKLGIFKAGHTVEEILASGDSSAFFPHGLGHSLGLDVHDVPSTSKPDINDSLQTKTLEGHESCYEYLRLRLVLQEGMVVTVEPGIYFSPHLLATIRNSPYIDHEILARYEKGKGVLGSGVGGVRIEDVVVVRKDGVENLTKVGSGRAWVESICSGEL